MLKIFNFFFKKPDITAEDLLSSWEDQTPRSKIMVLMKNFLKSDHLITKDQAQKIQEKLKLFEGQISSEDSSKNSMKQRIRSIFQKFSSKKSIENELMIKLNHVIQRDNDIIMQINKTLDSEEFSESGCKKFSRSLGGVMDLNSLFPLQKALFLKGLIENIILKVPRTVQENYLQEAYKYISSLESDKTDGSLKEVVETLKQFHGHISLIDPKQSINLHLNEIAENPLSSLYFAKKSLDANNPYPLQHLPESKKFDFLGENLNNQINDFLEIKKFNLKERRTSKDNDWFYKTAKRILAEGKTSPKQLVTQEIIKIVRESKEFSSRLLTEINLLIDSKSSQENILNLIEDLLNQNKDTISCEELHKIKGFIKEIKWNKIKTNFKELPKCLSLYTELKILSLQYNSFTKYDIDNIYKFVYSKIRIDNSVDFKIIFKNGKSPTSMIFIDFNDKDKRIDILLKLSFAEGEIFQIFPFEGGKIIKIPKDYYSIQTNNGYYLATKIYTKNNEGVLPIEKYTVDYLVNFHENSEDMVVIHPDSIWQRTHSGIKPSVCLNSQLEIDQKNGSGKNTLTFYTQTQCSSVLTEIKLESDNTNRIIDLCKCIVNGINTAHSLNIVHGDIKENNILVEGNQAYIIDWEGGMEVQSPIKLPLSFDYTNGYVIETEVTSCNQMAREYDKKSTNIAQKYLNLRKQIDIFELGVIFYKIASGGEFPYQLQKNNNLDILKERPTIGLTDKSKLLRLYTQDQSQIILKMLDPEPSQRPSAQEVLNVFS